MHSQKLPPGLELYEEYISERTETWLLEYLLKRCKKRYDFDSQKRTIRTIFQPGSPLRLKDECELFCRELASQFKKTSLSEKDLNNCQVGGYDPGDGIGPHIDSPLNLGESIITLNLGAGLALEFSLEQEKIEIYYPPRSLAIMRGASRYEYSHGISFRDYDLVDGVKIPRKKRFGIVWWHRKLALEWELKQLRQHLRQARRDLEKSEQYLEESRQRLALVQNQARESSE